MTDDDESSSRSVFAVVKFCTRGSERDHKREMYLIFIRNCFPNTQGRGKERVCPVVKRRVLHLLDRLRSSLSAILLDLLSSLGASCSGGIQDSASIFSIKSCGRHSRSSNAKEAPSSLLRRFPVALMHILNSEGTPTASMQCGERVREDLPGTATGEREREQGGTHYLEDGSKLTPWSPHPYRAQRFESPREHSTISRIHQNSQMQSSSHPENMRNYTSV